MRYIFLLLMIAISGFVFIHSDATFAAVAIPGGDTIKEVSITAESGTGDIITVGQTFGWRLLSLLKILISGVALIFMVFIGAYMIVYSDSEEQIKKQKNQILYTLIGFLFLNIPGMIYQVMSPASISGNIDSFSSWSNTNIFWYSGQLSGFIGNIVAFLRVFAYGSAILMITWGFFRLILSGGDEEQVKASRHRILYSILALMFLLFVEAWVRMVSSTGFTAEIGGLLGTIIKLALFFVAPVGIFFIIYGAYYFITSAGNEDRVKKGKSILWNTFIASIILIAAFSFLTDLNNFF